MGQKVHPGFFRSENNKFKSKWYIYDVKAADFIVEDVKIRRFLINKCRSALLSSIEIERAKNKTGNFDLKIDVYVSFPNIIIGQNNEKLEILKNELRAIISEKNFYLNILPVAVPSSDANIVARKMVIDLEKRLNYKILMKKAVHFVMKAGAKGCKIKISGRIDGADIARSESCSEGSIPLQTLKENITFARETAKMSYGSLGVKVWINHDKKKELDTNKVVNELNKIYVKVKKNKN